jgi:hypothetical protein
MPLISPSMLKMLVTHTLLCATFAVIPRVIISSHFDQSAYMTGASTSGIYPLPPIIPI